MESEQNSFHVDFPDFSSSLLKRLNQQRQLGQLCDITVVLQGQHYRAHRAVLAASSPYFSDQVLLKNSQQVVLPDVMQTRVFESLLQSCYTGALRLPAGEVVGFLTAASFLQMWHVVGKCTELLGGGPAKFCLSPSLNRSFLGSGSGYDSPPEDLDQEDFGEAVGYADKELEQLTDGESRRRISQGGNTLANQQSRPVHSHHVLMSHGRWAQEEAGWLELDDSGGYGDARQCVGARTEPSYPSVSCAADSNTEEKLEDETKGTRGEGQPYRSPMDFKASTSTAKDHPDSLGQEPGVSAMIGEERDGPVAPPAGLQKETTGFVTTPSKLLPCQRRRSISHDSQRDGHSELCPDLQPYGCAICGRVFRMKHHLVGHVKVHMAVKSHKCSICGERFRWRRRFKRHVSSCARAHQDRHATAQHTTQAR